ncbi:MAG: recombinase family protein [Alphaproteobacteria bacterium]|nr:recombinase family protein [Alphaproteobacteria bacterium]
MTIKCAIYTRKSTEHGLEQEFNSLQNQEESCKAYIASQSFNGWQYYKTYSDAAISGGTMERPALKQMLDDMAHGLVNTVVVYKVDRLSRSILDFHNMMKYFEKYGANFVSITQSFDTSTSMGKLTLNMLLSFAQFEREVSSERVRDKIRASKAKGLWMGGAPRLGYDLINKKLVVNPTEAEQVRHLFEKYLELQSVNDLTEYARQNGIYGKRWKTNKRKIRGGNPIAKMSMHRILRDKVYIGQIENKKEGTFAKGEHEPIISTELFNRVQIALANNANNKSPSTHAPNILTGKLFNHNGTKFINQRTSGKGKKTTYYYATKGFYLTAARVDEIVIKTITNFLNSDMSNLPINLATILKRIDVTNMNFADKRNLIQSLVEKLVYSQEQLIYTITTNGTKLQQFVSENYMNPNTDKMEYIIGDNSITITEKVFLRKYVNTVYDRGKNGVLNVIDNNHLILKAFATAWKYRELYEQDDNVDKVIRAVRTSSRLFYKYLALAYLNPQIVNKLLSGKSKISVRDILDKASNEHDLIKQIKIFSAQVL